DTSTSSSRPPTTCGTWRASRTTRCRRRCTSAASSSCGRNSIDISLRWRSSTSSSKWERAGDAMNTNRGLRFLAAALALLLLPVLARAEVSVSVDRQGNVKRIFFLTRGSGHGAQYWSQVRSYLRPEVVLNPLGDTYGDGAPVIQQDPRTRRPLVVWPHNAGNVKQLVFSAWTGRGWSDPAPVV